ncbi:MAG: hypothetical protein DM484_19500 [Candidatus Methylumidiphilus alinenensis]|uniref:Uncharacterized protein n=1 Tax=Candidatus Methylumidiphilus alinenensis TaxID=2202197 RepID=A0A2W4R4V1_9GAMM|nr:MAG: hypothetical protein DM484_19500 [Candidatus Methylumidiphilus alinenensis]
MVTFSRLLSAKIEGLDRGSMLDLKTIFRARKYTRRILNSLGKNGESLLIDDSIFRTAEIGRIHAKAAQLLAKVLSKSTGFHGFRHGYLFVWVSRWSKC